VADSASHYQEATKILAELEVLVNDTGADAQMRAQAAIAHALLAVGNELSQIKQRIPEPGRWKRTDSLMDLDK
jgi:hypothetical protein